MAERGWRKEEEFNVSLLFRQDSVRDSSGTEEAWRN